MSGYFLLELFDKTGHRPDKTTIAMFISVPLALNSGAHIWQTTKKNRIFLLWMISVWMAYFLLLRSFISFPVFTYRNSLPTGKRQRLFVAPEGRVNNGLINHYF